MFQSSIQYLSLFFIQNILYPTEICELTKEIGPCKASIPRFYYNSEKQKCEEFIYGGCGGNANNFETQEECEYMCGMCMQYS